MAYIFKPKNSRRLNFLPMEFTTSKQLQVRLDYFEEDRDFHFCQNMLNYEIEQGNSYPFQDSMNEKEFRSYFLSGDAFVLRQIASQKDESPLACFYIKPNFPGRCSHICNAGFIVHPSQRGKGLGKMMGQIFPRLAQALGYRASLFNLVFVSNKASLELWRSLGYQKLARIPEAGNLKNQGYIDAIQFYCDFSKENKHFFPKHVFQESQ